MYETLLNFVGNSIVNFSEVTSINPDISFLTLGIGLILFSWVLAIVGRK